MRYEDACHRHAALAEAKRREDAIAKEEHHRAVIEMRYHNESVWAAIAARQEQVLAVLDKWEQAADEQRRHKAATRGAETKALAVIEERHRHETVLAAEADEQRRHEAANQAADSKALTLVEECHCHEAVLAVDADKCRRHEAVLVAEAADEQRRQESAA